MKSPRAVAGSFMHQVNVAAVLHRLLDYHVIQAVS
jgi:hypothetical protein